MKLNQRMATSFALATIIALGFTAPVTAQSAGSYTSGSSYNPVQQAINRNSMNAAILKQATGGKHHTVKRATRTTTSTTRK